MISLVQTIPAGNALRVHMNPPAGCRSWRLLRKATPDIESIDDPAAFLAYHGGDKTPLDSKFLVNGETYFYRAFYLVGVNWVLSNLVYGTPSATYLDESPDVLSLLRERIDLGLAEEIRRGSIRHEHGRISVLTAPPQFEDTRWPCVTVHMQSESPHDRSMGEMLSSDEFDAIGSDWTESEGWIAAIQIQIITWSLNPDERIELRRAIRRILIANLPVLDAEGIVQVEFSQSDTEDFSSFAAPVYQSICAFSCLAPVKVTGLVGAISAVQSNFKDI